MPIEDHTEFIIWLNNGIDRGWITPPFCLSHDGLPLTVEETERDGSGEDIGDDCRPFVRVLDGDERLAWFGRWGSNVKNGKL